MSLPPENQVSNTKSGTGKKLPYFIVLFILIFGIGIYILWVDVVPSVSNVLNYVNRTPAPPPSYTATTVTEVCQLLKINSDDPFCADSNLKNLPISKQNAQTLRETLYRNFPIGQTTYDDIVPLLRTLPSQGENNIQLARN